MYRPSPCHAMMDDHAYHVSAQCHSTALYRVIVFSQERPAHLERFGGGESAQRLGACAQGRQRSARSSQRHPVPKLHFVHPGQRSLTGHGLYVRRGVCTALGSATGCVPGPTSSAQGPARRACRGSTVDRHFSFERPMKSLGTTRSFQKSPPTCHFMSIPAGWGDDPGTLPGSGAVQVHA